MKHACIAEHQGAYPVRLMCRLLAVSASGFYAAQRRGPSRRAVTDAQLSLAIRAVHRRTRRRYGSPRVTAELRAQGTPVSRKRVARLMRAEGLRGRGRVARRPRTTDSTHPSPIAPNVLARQFAVTPGARDRVWVADLTYVPTGQSWLYLAVVLDLASRRVVGWATGPTLRTTLPLTALRHALATRRPRPGLVHHSDRGVQYASAEYQAVLAAYGVTPSMSRRGDCWDNAVAESFFATLEMELLADAQWPTHETATRALEHFIEHWYNDERRHSSLGHVSPAQYELQSDLRALTSEAHAA